MRDPRSGFAKGFRNHHGAAKKASVAAQALGLTLCCACGAATAASIPERSPPPVVEQSATTTPLPEGAGPRVVSLRFQAPPDCPDADRYSSHVRNRSANLSVQPEADAPASDDAVDVRVEPAPGAPGWLGRVTIAGPLALDREVRGARCEDVIAALALITVLRLEGADSSALAAATTGTASSSSNAIPDTGTGATASATAGEGAPSPTASPSSELAASPSSATRVDPDGVSARTQAAGRSGASSAATAPAPQSELTPPRAAPPSATESTADQSTPEPDDDARGGERRRSSGNGEVAANDPTGAARADDPELLEPLAPDLAIRATESAADSIPADSNEPVSARASWRWPNVGAAAVGLRGGYASVPAHAFKAALEGELQLGEGWASELSIAYARGKDEVAVAKLDLSLLTIDVGLCPLDLGAESHVWLRACAGLRAGALHLAITPTQAGLTEATVWRPWASLGPSLRVGVPLSERWTLRGLAELALQLVRDNFDVEFTAAGAPGARRFTVYRPQALSLELGLGVGYSF